MGKLRMQQDPCAGCDNDLAQAYQTCMLLPRHPCTERDAAGIAVEGEGTKDDIGCCMKVEKHNRCLECKTMDCAYKTCKRNVKYYSEYTITENENKRDKKWDEKAIKAAGWGDAHSSGEGDTSAYAKREMGYEREGIGAAAAAYEYGEGR